MTNIVQKIALLPLPYAGVQTLLKSNVKNMLISLADNKSTTDEQLITIVNKKNQVAARQALTRVKDRDLLSYQLASHPSRKPCILRNRNISVELLEQYIADIDPAVRLSVYLNPSTPLSIKRAALSPSEVSACVEVGGFLGASVVRANELLLSNLWMLETPSKWPLAIRRAIATSPYLTKEINNELLKTGWTKWVNYKNHPFNQGIEINKLTTKELLSYPSSATDLVLTERKELTFAEARSIVNRVSPPAEPHVLSRLVHKFGHAVIAKPNSLAGTRVKSASWLNPSIAISAATDLDLINDLTEAVNTLSENHLAWENFITLSNNWTGSVTELALAAKRL